MNKCKCGLRRDPNCPYHNGTIIRPQTPKKLDLMKETLEQLFKDRFWNESHSCYKTHELDDVFSFIKSEIALVKREERDEVIKMAEGLLRKGSGVLELTVPDKKTRPTARDVYNLALSDLVTKLKEKE